MTSTKSNDPLEEYKKEYKAAIDNPKMPMVLRVGIIGHRKLSAVQVSHSMAQLERLFEMIASILSSYVSADNKHLGKAKEKRYHTISRTLYDLERHPIIRLTSALATGADRLGMHKSFADNYRQQLNIEYAAIIPFASNTYLKDFSDNISETQTGLKDFSDDINETQAGLTEKQEFKQILSTIAAQPVNRLIELDGVYDNASTRDNAYTNCAKRLIEHSDFVIAFYDENHTPDTDENHTAGTKQAIKMAISESRPVVQIDPNPDPNSDNRIKIIHSKRFGRDKGEEELTESALDLMLSRIALFADVFRLEKLADRPLEELEDRYDKLLQRPSHYESALNILLSIKAAFAVVFRKKSEVKLSGDELSEEELEKRYDAILRSALHYYREASKLTLSDTRPDYESKGSVASSYSFTEKIRGLDAFRVFRNLLTNKNDEDIPTAVLEKQRVAAPFFARYSIADDLAVRFAKRHQYTYRAIYLLASFAMITVAIGTIFKDIFSVPWVMVGGKVAALIIIFILYMLDHNQHHLWLQSRCLAEAIRPNTYFSVFGRCFSFFDRRSNDVFSHREVLGHSQSGGQWVCMHSEAVNRYMGFSHCQLAEEEYKMAIQSLRKDWLDRQITYHKNNARDMKELTKKLSAWTLILFWATAFFVAIKIGFLINFKYIGECSPWYYPSKVTTLLTLFFPVVGTSMFAIRNHAEFDISAQRSLTMRAVLYSMMDYFEDVEKTINHSPSKTSSQVDKGLNMLADVSVQEVADWLEIYEVKESEPG